MKGKLLISLACMLFIFCGLVQAQEKPDSVSYIMYSKYTSQGIKLRWMPTNMEAMLNGVENGFDLYRSEIDFAQDFDSVQYIQSTVQIATIYTKPESYFENHSDSMLQALGKALYMDETQYSTDSLHPLLIKEEQDREQEIREMMSGFVTDYDYSAALDAGWAYTDINLQPNHNYVYSLIPKGQAADTVYSMNHQFTSFFDNNVDVTGFEFTNDGKKISLYWDKEQNEEYIAYDVFKKDVAGIYQKLNEQPIPTPSYEHLARAKNMYYDEAEEYFTPYYYKVRGKDRFGDFGPYSEELEVVVLPPPIQLYPRIDTTYESSMNVIELEWSIDESKSDSILGFQLFRRTIGEDEFVRISDSLMAPTQITFSDTVPDFNVYKYKLVATDLYGYEQESFVKSGYSHDSIPPPAVDSFWVEFDKQKEQGILRWTSVDADDLKGYRILTSYKAEGPWFSVVDTVVIDTFLIYDQEMNVERSNLYLKIVAVDDNSNRSDALELATDYPDKANPGSPFFKLERTTGDSLVFIGNSGVSDDVEFLLLERRARDEIEWTVVDTIFQLDSTEIQVVDTTMEQGPIYYYQLVAVDEAFNRGESEEVKGFKTFTEGDSIIGNLQHKYNNYEFYIPHRDFKVLFSMDEDPERIEGFVVYRKVNDLIERMQLSDPTGVYGSHMMAFAAISKDECHFKTNNPLGIPIVEMSIPASDDRITASEFKITVMYKGGIESALSPSIIFDNN